MASYRALADFSRISGALKSSGAGPGVLTRLATLVQQAGPARTMEYLSIVVRDAAAGGCGPGPTLDCSPPPPVCGLPGTPGGGPLLPPAPPAPPALPPKGGGGGAAPGETPGPVTDLAKCAELAKKAVCSDGNVSDVVTRLHTITAQAATAGMLLPADWLAAVRGMFGLTDRLIRACKGEQLSVTDWAGVCEATTRFAHWVPDLPGMPTIIPGLDTGDMAIALLLERTLGECCENLPPDAPIPSWADDIPTELPSPGTPGQKPGGGGGGKQLPGGGGPPPLIPIPGLPGLPGGPLPGLPGGGLPTLPAGAPGIGGQPASPGKGGVIINVPKKLVSKSVDRLAQRRRLR